jgi:phytoene desaturase
MAGRRVIIVGAGFGGLAAAIRLAARGFEVEIFEKLDRPGGRARPLVKGGITFDAGPTVVTAPFMFDELFEICGRRRGDYVELLPVEPFYRIFDQYGRYFETSADRDEVERQIQRWSPEDARGYRRLLEETEPVLRKAFLEMADRPFLDLTDMLRIVPDLVRL